jgi:hypothetical protein
MPASVAQESPADSDLISRALEAYFEELMSAFDQTALPIRAESPPEPVAEAAFRILTSRQFCYLSRSRTERYRASALEMLQANVDAGEPLRFFLDIGAGYHASLDPDTSTISCHVGLGEFFILFQIAELRSRIARIYGQGIKFSLVIDNLCGALVNDIRLEDTLQYVESLKRLINDLNLNGVIDLTVESEHFGPANYSNPVVGLDSLSRDVGKRECMIVSRFTGRVCSLTETRDRVERYRAVTEDSERLLATLIDGVHMTQRATESTLCFRAFPGGDSRMQSGEVAITTNRTGRLIPTLLTSSNAAHFDISVYALEAILPAAVSRVRFASIRS